MFATPNKKPLAKARALGIISLALCLLAAVLLGGCSSKEEGLAKAAVSELVTAIRERDGDAIKLRLEDSLVADRYIEVGGYPPLSPICDSMSVKVDSASIDSIDENIAKVICRITALNLQDLSDELEDELRSNPDSYMRQGRLDETLVFNLAGVLLKRAEPVETSVELTLEKGGDGEWKVVMDEVAWIAFTGGLDLRTADIGTR